LLNQIPLSKKILIISIKKRRSVKGNKRSRWKGERGNGESLKRWKDEVGGKLGRLKVKCILPVQSANVSKSLLAKCILL
jgi:hypothetical protein